MADGKKNLVFFSYQNVGFSGEEKRKAGRLGEMEICFPIDFLLRHHTSENEKMFANGPFFLFLLFFFMEIHEIIDFSLEYICSAENFQTQWKLFPN
jgi:hypothetical protein